MGTLTPLIVADLMQDTGRYNLASGAVQGIGASLSGLATGINARNPDSPRRKHLPDMFRLATGSVRPTPVGHCVEWTSLKPPFGD